MSASTIRLLHLTTGEDIIGRMRLDDAQVTWIIEDAVMPNMAIDPSTGAVRVGLLPVRPYADTDHMQVSTLHVIYDAPLTEQMENAYRSYCSGIVAPATPSLSSLLTN
jgi:hypothetical protein